MHVGMLLHRRGGWKALIAAVSLVGAAGVVAVAAPASSATTLTPKATGLLDCNGYSPLQKPLRATMSCTDIRGLTGVDNANTDDGRFYDNGHYIGHDEPDMTFYSAKPGSGENVTWTETLGQDPSGKATDTTPGSDVSHWFELSVAPWFSMAMCDPNSYPQLPCTPGSDANAPACPNGNNCDPNSYPGGGGAFMEMQFYPPGFAPFADSTSCDNTHWCSALTIDSLECTYGFAQCNPNCEEPVNFAFIQTDGIPTGPPSPQLADLNTETPNAATLLMNQGDKVQVHMFNAPARRGSAFEVAVDDLTTGKTGFMQASAANGFANTSILDCSGTPFNFQPEYSTAAKGNIIPWAALQTDVSTEYEIGHWEACTSLTRPGEIMLPGGITDKTWADCHGPYEVGRGDGSGQVESTDAPCYPQGDTHGMLNAPPDTLTGCTDTFAGGDLDFDGSSYWREWPTGPAATALYPASFVEQLPTTDGAQYGRFMIQTDLALSETTTCGAATPEGCTVPPKGPGHFYPYWSRSDNGGTCTIQFGNVSLDVNNYGMDAQYGRVLLAKLGYPEFEGPVQSNTCTPGT
jgi:hypothetical protein